MEYRRFKDKILVRMDPKDEILHAVMQIAEKEKIELAECSALGAVNDFTVGLYDLNQKKYLSNHYAFPAEIVSLWGTISQKDGKPYLHIHMSAADGSGKVYGGHLNEAYISVTCEMVITLIDGHADHRLSEETGLNILDFDR